MKLFYLRGGMVEDVELSKRESTKLSFQLSTSVSKKRKLNTSLLEEDINEEVPREVISSFSSSTVSATASDSPMVIPLPKDINSGKLGIRKSQGQLMLARIARGEDVDMEENSEEEIVDTFTGTAIPIHSADDLESDLPLLLRNRRLELESIGNEDERFRKDVEDRPNACSLEEYERVPIESFGEALLRGMNWKPGMQVGMNGRGLTKPIEFVPRPRGLGLGAHSSQQKKKHKRKGQEGKPVLVVKKDADGRQRHYRDLDEELVDIDHEKKQFKVGAMVMVISGRHKDLTGQIEKVFAEETFLVRFNSGETDTFPLNDISLLSKYSSSQRKEKPRYKEQKPPKSSSSYEKEREPKKEKRCWMQEGIVVRIVSKSFKEGRYYRNRVQILDVISNKECSVTLEGRVIEGVRERMIETALPKPGGKILILSGKHRGRHGTLKSRNSKHNEAVVQHKDDLSIGTYPFEAVAEYVG